MLVSTYPRYTDARSREAVEAVWVELVRLDEAATPKLGVAEQILGWLANEVGRLAKRNSPKYVESLQSPCG